MYDVMLEEKVSYLMEVEANNEEEAIGMGWEMLDEGEDSRNLYFNDVEEFDATAEEFEENGFGV